MSVILYARVSTGQQAEKELSIPAQLRALRAYASECGWEIAGEFQDVASGWNLTQRPNLSAALRLARNGEVDHLLVHKSDRLSRNTYQYLTIKGQLRTCGVNIVSVVERFEDNPMGEFMEHIMAAQSEFYSANLSFEVKKGLEERLRRGRWNGQLPIGYIKSGDKVMLDPARAAHVRFAFERWANGNVATPALANELFERGLVGRNGKPIAATKLCDVLKNPFYIGIMKTASGEYAGLHPHLIPRELFKRCQEVFRQRCRRGGKPATKLHFLLSGLIHCPKCAALLVGERHIKKSGKIFRYYRCHRANCKFNVRAEGPETKVMDELLQLDLPRKLGPILQARVRREKRKRDERQVADVRALRQRLRELGEEKRELARRLASNLIAEENFDQERKLLSDTERLTAWMLANKERDVGGENLNLNARLALLDDLRKWPTLADEIEKKRVLTAFVARVDLSSVNILQICQQWQGFDYLPLSGNREQKTSFEKQKTAQPSAVCLSET